MAIAIIGAGIAGLSAARTLADAGHDVVLFDKSRGLGGRMATRRVGDMTFDHGAQYFTARGKDFRVALDKWRARGQAADWFDESFVGTPGMTAPARALAEGLTIVPSTQVTGLRRVPAGWTVLDAGGPIGAPGNGSFDTVVLAVPAPQALPLAESAHVRFEAMDRVEYAPCWALMLAFSEKTGLPDRDRRDDGAIAWIARNASKPGRSASPETIVVHASPGWSRTHLECAPEDAAVRLLGEFRAFTGLAATPTYMNAHRWRYALVERPAGEDCLWNAQAHIGACGDWCIGPRVEAAFDSGLAMANLLLRP